MRHKNQFIQRYGLWIIDMICITVSYLIATQIRFAAEKDFGDVRQHYLVGLAFLMVCTVYSFFTDWNRDFLVRGALKELGAILRYNAILMLFGLTFAFFTRWTVILSRVVIFWFFLLNFVLMLLSHLLVKLLLRKLLRSSQLVRKLVVITQPDRATETLARIGRRESLNTELAALCLTEEGEAPQVPDELLGESVPVFSGLESLTEKLTAVPFDEVFIDAPDVDVRRIHPLIYGFEEMGVEIYYRLELPELGSSKGELVQLGEDTAVSFAPAVNRWGLVVKRLMDIAGGLVGSLITLLLTIVLVPVIKLDSPGPVFFKQTRVGKNGRRFTIYKYRSMYKDAEARLASLMKDNEMKGLMFKMEDDPRVTRVGAFLRRTSLDEFPQFFNVLKGDMSLVGTRPPTEREFEQYNEHYRRRISMTPGLTGLWQVSGRSDITDFDEVVKLDLQYIDNWSILLDLKILIKTVGVVLFGKGAK